MTTVYFGGLGTSGDVATLCARMTRAAQRWPESKLEVATRGEGWLGCISYGAVSGPGRDDGTLAVRSMRDAGDLGEASLATTAEVDPREGRVELRGGITPVFYARAKGAVFFASDPTLVRAALDSPPPVDRHSVVALLHSNHLPPGRSLFAGIQQVPPFHRVVATKQGWSGPESDLRERVDALQPAEPTTLEQVAERFEWVTQQAVGDGADAILPLTGGVDSRAILAASDAPSLLTYTRGAKSDGEVRTARRLAAALGVTHHAYPYAPRHLERYLPRVVHLNGGCVSVRQGLGIHPLMELAGTGRRRVLPGANGEFGRGFWPAAPFGSTPWSDRFRLQLLRTTFKLTNPPIAPLLAADLRSELSDIEHCVFAEYFEGLPSAGESSVRALDWTYLLRRVGRSMIWGPYLWSSALDVRLPYLDAEYVRRVAGLPDSLRGEASVACAVVARRAPELMRIPLEPSGLRLDTGRSPRGRRLWRGLQRRLGRERHTSADYSRWLLEERDFVERLLEDSRAVEAGIFDGAALRETWSAQLAGRNRTRILLKILTVELALRIVRDEGSVLWEEDGPPSA